MKYTWYFVNTVINISGDYNARLRTKLWYVLTHCVTINYNLIFSEYLHAICNMYTNVLLPDALCPCETLARRRQTILEVPFVVPDSFNTLSCRDLVCFVRGPQCSTGDSSLGHANKLKKKKQIPPGRYWGVSRKTFKWKKWLFFVPSELFPSTRYATGFNRYMRQVLTHSNWGG